jgi:hypothetical protein
MSDEVATFTVTLASREITFRRPSLGSIMMLQRLTDKKLKQARAEGSKSAEGEAVASMIARSLDVVETLFVNPDDAVFVEEQMLLGNIDYMEIVSVLRGGRGTDPAQDDDVTPLPKKRTAKAVGKKAPPATSRASGARAKR